MALDTQDLYLMLTKFRWHILTIAGMVLVKYVSVLKINMVMLSMYMSLFMVTKKQKHT